MMASQLAGLIRDQNLNVHFNGTSTGDKSTVSKASKNGVRGNRKPLGDLSNSVKPTPNHSLKKQNSNFLSDKEIGASISKITIDGAKRKCLSKAPEKLQSSSRALCDISNSGKSHLHEAPKKNLQTKLRVVAEEDLSAIAEEGFLHNHQECIKAQNKAMDIDELLQIVGLNKGFLKKPAPPQLSKQEPASPPTCLDVEDLPHEQLEELSPWKYDQFSDLDSPPPYRSPKSPNRYMQWTDYEDANFMLMESP